MQQVDTILIFYNAITHIYIISLTVSFHVSNDYMENKAKKESLVI